MCPKPDYLGICNWKENGKVETGGRGFAAVAVGFVLLFDVFIFLKERLV